MDIKYYKDTVSNLDIKFTNNKIKKFLPIITKNFFKDSSKFSKFWKDCNSQLNILEKNKNQKSFKKNLINLNKISTLCNHE